MVMDWADISYLRAGTPRQQAAYTVLHDLDIFSQLHPYSPLLAGTIPLAVYTPQSDLDIICEAHNLNEFMDTITDCFGHHSAFVTRQKRLQNTDTAIIYFEYDEFPLEVFAQPRPVRQQNAYRHLLVESRLLAIGGDAARETIRTLKASGMKTEPAFAHYFHLAGDPYAVLLELSYLDAYELRSLIARRRFE